MTMMVVPDNDLKQNVLEEFVYDSALQIADVGVQADDGVITLTGTVDSYLQKVAAEQAALRVEGVRAVANELVVRTPRTYNDTDLAKAVVMALEAHVAIPADRLDIAVQNGKVTLGGEVDWPYQRASAERSVHHLRGVRDVINRVQVKHVPVPSAAIAAEIERALLRAAAVEANRIGIHTENGHVRLTGIVRSWAEKAEAGFAAWRAKGVTEVTNDIEVRPN